MRLILFGLCLFTLSACLPGKPPPEPTAAVGTPEFVEQQESVCTASGGNFGSAPGGGTRVCYVTPQDANQPCQLGTDCEGHCLARSRTCAPIIPMFGCNEVLLNSGGTATICLD